MFKRKFCKWSLASLLVSAALATQANQTFQSEKADFHLETVAAGLEHPWDIAFLPDGSALITEREGRLRILEDGQLRGEPIEGLPELVVSGQGGLLDVLLHPDFENNRVLFLSYAHRNRDGMTTRVARATLADNSLQDVEV